MIEELQELEKDITKALDIAGIPQAEIVSQPITIDRSTKLTLVGLLQKSSRAQVMDIAKSNNISWEESSNPGINWIRASRAILRNMSENSDGWVIYQDIIKSSSTEQNRHVRRQNKKEDEIKKGVKEKTLIIESSNPSDTPEVIEETLEKALASIRTKRENKEFTDVYLKSRKDESDVIVSKVFANMVDEISQVLSS